MKNKKILGILMSVLMAIIMIPLFTFAADLPFTDVSTSAWYYSDVKGAYDTGLINGMTATTFEPESNMTYAQAVKLAACMNQKYSTGLVTLANGSPNWWDSYVTYAKEKNIINKDYNWNSNATRAGYVEIFASALPDEALKSKNTVIDGAIPDVDNSHPQASAIYKLYRAGILTGNDEKGTFLPNNHIKRSEVCAILTRMMNESARKELSLKKDSSGNSSVDFSAVNVGDYVAFGHYEQDNNMSNGKESIEWKVLEKKNGRILVLSKYGLDCQPYNEDRVNVYWEFCTLRRWLNSSFLNEAFTSSEKSVIPIVTITNSDNSNFKARGGNDTNDQVFLLSKDEALTYFKKNEERKAVPTVYAVAQGAHQFSGTLSKNDYFGSLSDYMIDGQGCCWWWLRSPGRNNTFAGSVNTNGTINANQTDVSSLSGTVRPAMWINIAS